MAQLNFIYIAFIAPEALLFVVARFYNSIDIQLVLLLCLLPAVYNRLLYRYNFIIWFDFTYSRVTSSLPAYEGVQSREYNEWKPAFRHSVT